MSIVHDIFENVKKRDPDQPEFHQAVWEVLESLEPVLENHPEFVEAGNRKKDKHLLLRAFLINIGILISYIG